VSGDHYSYTLYADPKTAAEFDDQRFGGPIGELVAASQAAVVANFVGRINRRRILDVGTGTGRAALMLARGGAEVVAVDASEPMLEVARRRAAEQSLRIDFRHGDAHQLEFRDRAFDVVVCLRLLMHSPSWRTCLAELCRVADQLVIIDYPSARSAARLESAARRLLDRFGVATEPYRVFVDRQIAPPDRAGGAGAGTGRPAQGGGVAGDARGRTVPALVTGATGFTGGHLARQLAASGEAVRVLVRDPAAAGGLRLPGIEIVQGDVRDAQAVRAALAGVDVVYQIAALYRQAGLPESTYRAVNATAAGALVEAAAAAGVRRVVHCSTVGVHGDIRRPPADEEAPLAPGDVYQTTKLEGEQLARAAGGRLGIEVTVVRPSGIYGPGDRRLLKLFRGVARGRFPMLGRGDIYYHLTYIDDLVEGFRRCGSHPAAAGRTYILAGGEVTTLSELVAIVAETAGVRPPRWHLPVWPFWAAGAVCEAVCAPLGLEPPLYRRRVDFYTKSRAFDIGRARREIGFEPKIGLREGIARTLSWYRQHGWI
jgi:dihydroflavonol-4-reductase